MSGSFKRNLKHTLAVFCLCAIAVVAITQSYFDGEADREKMRMWFDDCRTKHTIEECRVLYNVYYPEQP